ncbi:hypothetical protein H5P28_01495 [Ruficoccus amylovorans]|uniref:Uncharacterized protein n=1 Tax=Ruficoccus amylovorans TaxID=1804625 RepID=A0A842HBH9_9BACT|nr:hypothetical protein [Ruficoccus amylovorans]MBC2592924.1 hypothetical protein [Ruficoccus amylovorans]
MTDELALPDGMKSVAGNSQVRRVYGERVTRWFKDKSSADSQWPPTVDKRPGIRLDIRTERGGFDLGITHEWPLTSNFTLSGEMRCADNAWRSPTIWNLAQTFTTTRGNEILPAIVEQGRWENARVQTVTTQGTREIRNARAAPAFASVYALMAAFPDVSRGGLGEALLQEETLSFVTSARIKNAPKELQRNKLAQGLTGYTVYTATGYPADYWLNENGVVIYVCWGPNRAFVLEQSEELA